MYPSFNARALGLSLSIEETLKVAAGAGFSGVDVMVRDLLETGESAATVARRMTDLGLRGGAFPMPFDWRGSGFAEGLARLPRVAEAASTLGLVRTGTWVLPECPVGFDRAGTFAFHLDRLAPIVETLSDFGIRLGLEVIGVESSRPGRNAAFVHRLADLGPLRDALERATGSPVGVVVDSWHLFAAGEPTTAGLAWGADSVVWVHVADLPPGAWADRSTLVDSVRGLPGERGIVDSRGLLTALDVDGYTGPVTAEPLASCRSLTGQAPETVARRTAEALRRVWPAGRPFGPAS